MNTEKTILLASDHAGFELKKVIKHHLEAKGIETVDLGTESEESIDYPDFGHKIGKLISEGRYKIGISLCGSGNGINMTANKHKGVRGALCWNEEIAQLASSHNNANLCALPARFLTAELAIKIVDTFLDTGFDGGRHERRIEKIDL